MFIFMVVFALLLFKAHICILKCRISIFVFKAYICIFKRLYSHFNFFEAHISMFKKSYSQFLLCFSLCVNIALCTIYTLKLFRSSIFVAIPCVFSLFSCQSSTDCDTCDYSVTISHDSPPDYVPAQKFPVRPSNIAVQ